MHTAYHNELILLAVARNGDDLSLRIDRNGLAWSRFEGSPVAELQLMACSDIDSVFNTLNVSIDKPIEYEVEKGEAKVAISIWVDYALDELQADCIQVNEALTDYTLEDWQRKTERLARLCAADRQAKELSDYIYHLLITRLSKMIRKELDLYQHKIEFFTRTNPEKAALLTGQAQAYQKVLRLIGAGEGDGKALKAQIRAAMAQIWSDAVWHQATYAADVERRIEDLGDAALFPLLEIVKETNPWYMRDEAMLILGLIDAKVKEDVMQIVQPETKTDEPPDRNHPA